MKIRRIKKNNHRKAFEVSTGDAHLAAEHDRGLLGPWGRAARFVRQVLPALADHRPRRCGHQLRERFSDHVQTVSWVGCGAALGYEHGEARVLGRSILASLDGAFESIALFV